MQGDNRSREPRTPGMSTPGSTSDRVGKGIAARDEPAKEVRQKRMGALERFLSGPKLHISQDGRMPAAEERNARR